MRKTKKIKDIRDLCPVKGMKGAYLHDMAGRMFKRSGMAIPQNEDETFTLIVGGVKKDLKYGNIFPFVGAGDAEALLDLDLKNQEIEELQAECKRLRDKVVSLANVELKNTKLQAALDQIKGVADKPGEVSGSDTSSDEGDDTGSEDTNTEEGSGDNSENTDDTGSEETLTSVGSVDIESIDFGKMTVDMLKEFVVSNKFEIEGYKSMKKADLIEAIIVALKESQAE